MDYCTDYNHGTDRKMQLTVTDLRDDRWVVLVARLAIRRFEVHGLTAVLLFPQGRSVRLRGMRGTELVFQVLREDDSDKVVVFEHGDCILARCRKFMRYVVLVSLISLRHLCVLFRSL